MAGMGGMDPALVQAMMSDPEIMALMQKPELMQKLQAMMANPGSAMQYANDPDVQTIMRKLQGAGAGGGGGFGAGAGGYGSAAPAASAGAAPVPGTVTEITSTSQFTNIIDSAGSKLVAVDFSAEWCGPCKMIAPTFKSLAGVYKQAIFLKVDGDKNRALAMMKKIEAYPTFQFYKNGVKVDEMKGADVKQLEALVAKYAEDEQKEDVSPYKNFPLREEECVKYDTIKWDVVEKKIEEFSETVDANLKLTADDISDIQNFCDTMSRRESYLKTSIAPKEFAVITDKLLLWPDKVLPPVLNMVRASAFHPNFAERMISNPAFLTNLLKIAENEGTSEGNQVQILQFFCNALTKRALTMHILEKAEEVLNGVAALVNSSSKKIRQAYGCLLINFAISIFYREKASKNKANPEAKDNLDYANAKVHCLSAAVGLVGGEQTAAGIYRVLVTIGTLIYRDEESKTIASTMDLESTLDEYLKDSKLSADANLVGAIDELKKSLSGSV